ncbi:MAG: hypothetical protein APF81_15760 [Desulfosporosinus sp. BRH_c37]|nr:MAG: hypothetical protein APF81_15760 [Desulfosporosinus sp. BRH_c37]
MNNSSRVDIRVKRTKKLIIGAMLELITEKPYNQITINNIAERAMINRNTFYMHFTDKPMLLNQILSDCIEDLKTELNIVNPLNEKNYAHLVAWYEVFLKNIQKNKILKLAITTTDEVYIFLQKQLHDYFYDYYLYDIVHDPAYDYLTINQKKMRAEYLVSADIGLARYILLNDDIDISIKDIIISVLDFNYCFLFPEKIHELCLENI